MATITSTTGLVSGINTGSIIDQLMTLEAQPKTNLQTRMDTANQQKLAFTDISTRLTTLKLGWTTLKKPSTFQAATAASSDPNVLTATAQKGAAIGSFQFQVARLVQSQQSVTQGFSSADKPVVGAGTLTLELGGGDLATQTLLSQLNGGDGVRRGSFKITDRNGNTSVIDTSAAVSVDDVLKKINTSIDINVRATLQGGKIVLTDLSGKSGNLIVADLGNGHSAQDLGLSGTATGTNPLTGQIIQKLGLGSSLRELNDGRGVRTNSAGTDFRVSVGNNQYDISLNGVKTIGDVLTALNAAAPTKFKAQVNTAGNGILLSDLTGSGAPFTVTALNGSHAAADLGIEKTGSAAQISGSAILAGINSVLISSLNGGSGLPLGAITIADRTNNGGAGADTIDLSSATSVQDILDAINNAPHAKVLASLNASGNGIQLIDKSGGTGNLVIGNSDPSVLVADALGIKGSFATTVSTVKGVNLQRQWVNENTLLKDYNGGRGVNSGQFKITNSKGKTAIVTIPQNDNTTIKTVLDAINTANIGITASINAHGDGILITDTAGGAAAMKIEEMDGTTANDLGIKGTAVANAIDGSFEKTITVAATDSLQDVQKKINDLNLGCFASILNDGTGTSPYRLSLNSRNAGHDGRVIFDAGDTLLQTRNLVEAQDSAVFYGGSSSDQPLLITSGTNQITNVIPGVTVELHNVSTSPVTLSTTRNIDDVAKQANDFTDQFNQMVDKITDLTKFDATTMKGGLLLGDFTLQQVQSMVYSTINTSIPGAGRYHMLSDIGFTLGDGGKLTFDEDKFRTAFATDPDAVSQLFTLSQTTDGKLQEMGIASKMEASITRLIDPVSGLITRENSTLDNRVTQFQDRIKDLDALLAAKRTRLEKQFAQMESVLAGLKSQQSALSSLSPATAATGA